MSKRNSKDSEENPDPPTTKRPQLPTSNTSTSTATLPEVEEQQSGYVWANATSQDFTTQNSPKLKSREKPKKRESPKVYISCKVCSLELGLCVFHYESDGSFEFESGTMSVDSVCVNPTCLSERFAPTVEGSMVNATVSAIIREDVGRIGLNCDVCRRRVAYGFILDLSSQEPLFARPDSILAPYSQYDAVGVDLMNTLKGSVIKLEVRCESCELKYCKLF
jgi:hypothetical protein